MIIGITGKAGSGKDTAASLIRNILYDKGEVYNIKHFALNVKKIFSIVSGLSLDEIESFKNDESYSFNGRTVRENLQYIGTNMFRYNYNATVWSDALFAKYIPNNIIHFKHDNAIWKPISRIMYSAVVNDRKTVHSIQDLILLNAEKMILKESKWIVADVRFNNEAEYINSHGTVINIIRNGLDTGNHESERGIKKSLIKYNVYNNGTIEELEQKLKELL
jgi:hypothetical protein